MSLIRILDRMLIFLACAALFAMMLMTFLDVILRSAFNAPIEPATELTRIFMVIIVFSVLPRLSYNREHIVVDLTDGIFARFGLERIRDGIIQISCGLSLIWPASQVWTLTMRAKKYGDITEYLSIPQYLIGAFVVSSVAITALILIIHGVSILLPNNRAVDHD